MHRTPPLSRLFPKIFQSHPLFYNLLVILFSCGMGILVFAVLSLLALLGAFGLSEKLSAGMAGMSFILVFQAAAALAAMGLALFLLFRNLRRP